MIIKSLLFLTFILPVLAVPTGGALALSKDITKHYSTDAEIHYHDQFYPPHLSDIRRHQKTVPRKNTSTDKTETNALLFSLKEPTATGHHAGLFLGITASIPLPPSLTILLIALAGLLFLGRKPKISNEN